RQAARSKRAHRRRGVQCVARGGARPARSRRQAREDRHRYAEARCRERSGGTGAGERRRRHSPSRDRRASARDHMTTPTPCIVVGLMSGTSLDGISAAVVRFDSDDDGRITYQLLGMSVRAYDAGQRERLAKALVGATPREYCRLSFDLADWLAEAAIAAM